MKNKTVLASMLVVLVWGIWALPSARLQTTSGNGQQNDNAQRAQRAKQKNHAKLAKQAKITKEQARQIALQRVPGTVVEEELEKEKGKLVYEFEIRTAEKKIFDVTVDAENGNVISVEEEKGDDDDDKDDDDNDNDNDNS